MALTYYQILGVDSRAGFAELKRAYYRQAKRCHPDLFRNAPEKTREFQMLALAFDTLSDAEKRRRYDRSLLTDTELIRRDHARPVPVRVRLDDRAEPRAFCAAFEKHCVFPNILQRNDRPALLHTAPSLELILSVYEPALKKSDGSDVFIRLYHNAAHLANILKFISRFHRTYTR